MSHSANILITIDSADRDTSVYPRSSEYTYPLATSIRNAATIEVMTFQMVASEQVINPSNNTFQITSGSTTSTCTIPIGNWTTTSNLDVALQTALSTATPSAPTITTAITATGRFALTSTVAPFSLTISASLSRILGFVAPGSNRGAGTIASTLVAPSTNTITGNKAIEPTTIPYVLMYVNDYEMNTGITIPTQTSFLLVPLENKALGQRFIICNDLKEKKGCFRLTGGQHKIDNLKIRFTRPDGTPYDFNGTDHQIVFRVTKVDCKDYKT